MRGVNLTMGRRLGLLGALGLAVAVVGGGMSLTALGRIDAAQTSSTSTSPRRS
jgi:hypothetical protein